MFFFYSWDAGSSVNLGFLDTRHCPHCNGHKSHTLLRRHWHFIFMIIPLYWSNKYYSVCSNCGQVTKIDKQEAKFIHKLNMIHFPTLDSLNIFSNTLRGLIPSDILVNGQIDQQRLSAVKDEIYAKFAAQMGYPKTFFDNFVNYLVQDMSWRTAPFDNAAPAEQPQTQVEVNNDILLNEIK